jgi:hypothetical protein
LLGVGYLVGVLVMAPVIRQINGPDIHWAGWTVSLASWLESNWWLPPVLVVVAIALLLAWVYSRSRFSRPARVGLFCNTLADQFAHDVPEDVAIRAAAEMSGDPELIAVHEPSLKAPAVARLLASTSFPGESLGISNQQALVAQLRYLGSVHMEKARRRGYFWSRLVPRAAMVLIGGGLTLAYAWWVIAPVYVQVAQW